MHGKTIWKQQAGKASVSNAGTIVHWEGALREVIKKYRSAIFGDFGELVRSVDGPGSFIFF